MNATFGETEFIAWVTEGAGVDLPVGPGDDAALLPDGTVIGVDAIVEGVHFPSDAPPDLVARKALGSCLSDVCAMGARAETVLVAAQLSPGCDGRALAAGLSGWAERFDVALAGGDTVRTHAGALALAVTATGRCEGEPWLRSGGEVDDRLVVTGPLGGSGEGRHLRVRPRADVVARLRAAGVAVHACLDLSDGLGRDLPRLCEASGVGAVVAADAIPVHDDVRGDADPLAAALGDGEDFELLLALPPSVGVPEGCVEIGRLVAGDRPLLDVDGRSRPWPEGGYEHHF